MKVDKLPAAHEFWDRPAANRASGDTPEAIYTAVGRALTQWELLEDLFSDIFLTVLSTDSYAAKRAYGVIGTARGRREALVAAATVFFREWSQIPKDEEARFRVLEKHYSDGSSRRNDIAHGVVSAIRLDEGTSGYFLAPAGYNSSKTKPFADFDEEDWLTLFRGKYRLTAEEVSEFAQRFTALREAAEEWLAHLKGSYLGRP